MDAIVPATARRDALYHGLMVERETFGNMETFARMLASQRAGSGILPPDLGLGVDAFHRLLVRYFPESDALTDGLFSALFGCGCWQDREAERDEIGRLLFAYRLGEDESEIWMASAVAAGCRGGDHLWQDLGLWSRRDVTELMERNFPRLAAQNVQDMKWKKFLYKQLCRQEGIYTCRAPSCQVCDDYALCFSPEYQR